MKRIAFITDIHLNEQFPLDNNVNPTKNFEKVLTDIENRKIDEIIFGGDIGEASAHSYFFDKLKKYSLRLILGNHDKFEEVKQHFFKDIYQEELYYKAEDENYQYIFLEKENEDYEKRKSRCQKVYGRNQS